MLPKPPALEVAGVEPKPPAPGADGAAPKPPALGAWFAPNVPLNPPPGGAAGVCAPKVGGAPPKLVDA